MNHELLQTRRSKAAKRKSAVIHQEEPNRFMSSHIVRETNKPSKVACFFDESLLTCDICLEIMHNAMKWVCSTSTSAAYYLQFVCISASLRVIINSVLDAFTSGIR